MIVAYTHTALKVLYRTCTCAEVIRAEQWGELVGSMAVGELHLSSTLRSLGSADGSKWSVARKKSALLNEKGDV